MNYKDRHQRITHYRPVPTERRQRDCRVKSGYDGGKTGQTHPEGRSQALRSLCYHCGVTRARRPSSLMGEIKGSIIGLISRLMMRGMDGFKE